MDGFEIIKEYMKFENGRCSCTCFVGKKLCSRSCSIVTVYRDRHEGWQDALANRDGRGRDDD